MRAERKKKDAASQAVRGAKQSMIGSCCFEAIKRTFQAQKT